MYEIVEIGFVVITRQRLLRLLGKGNESRGTWDALIEVWEEIGQNANSLKMVKFSANEFLFFAAEVKQVNG